MAVTNAIRYNLQAGTLGSSMAQSDTTINLGANVPDFPTLNNAASGDYIPITLINSTALHNSEIVYMTGYTAGNTTGQVIRGQETASGAGASASWPSANSWEHAPSAVDMQGPQGWQIAGNTTGTTSIVKAGTVTLVGGSDVTLSQASGNAFTFNAAPAAMSQFPNQAFTTSVGSLPYSGSPGAGAASTATTISAYLYPFPLPNPLEFNEIRIPANISYTTTVTSVNWSATNGITLGLYTLTGGTLNLVSSWSNVMALSEASTNTSGSGSATWQMSYGGNGTQYTSSASLSTATNTAAGFWTALSGSKMVPLMAGSSARLTDGMYWAMVAGTISTAGSAFLFQPQLARYAQQNLSYLQDVGLTSTGNTTNFWPLMGSFSTILRSDTIWPSTLATSQISTTGQFGAASNSFFFLFNRKVT